MGGQMAKRKQSDPKPHKFRNKLLLNQWLVSLFGIDPLVEHTDGNGKKIRPFHKLAAPISDPALEGLDHDNLHHFYHTLVNSNLFWGGSSLLTKEQILTYEENIVRHSQAINEKRHRPIVWKYYQWLTLLFVEIYLDRFFGNIETLTRDLNLFVKQFNLHWFDYTDVPLYAEDDLNKLCLQLATGSGKTLLMHVNLLQYRHYAKMYGKEKELSRVILLTPNERLSRQHFAEFGESCISASHFSREGYSLFTQAQGLERVDVLEITKLDHFRKGYRNSGPPSPIHRSWFHPGLNSKNPIRNTAPSR